MAEIKCNQSNVLHLYLDMPFTGAWTAVVETDDEVVPVGSAILTLYNEDTDNLSTFSGTVVWGSTWGGRSKYTVVAGNGTLNKLLPAQNYIGVPTPLNAFLLMEHILISPDVPPIAEILEPETAARLALKTLPLWQVAAQQRGKCVSNLAKELGLNWRMLDNGQLAMLEDTWPTVDLEPYVVDPGDDGIARAIAIAPDGAPYRPGTTVLGRQVYRVSYSCSPDATRATLFYLATGA